MQIKNHPDERFSTYLHASLERYQLSHRSSACPSPVCICNDFTVVGMTTPIIGKIPPESTLIFNIDLLEIRNGPRSHESFQEMDLNDDWKLSKHEVKVYLKKEFEKHGAVVNESHHDVLVEDIFDKEDEDKDGFISAREFTYVHDEL
ncbi:peptidyl-prolyl cis-trans isomerase FKBP14 isoform X2 [Nannospalax galili]|uniref:peptidyl-prolyl cis-trans isomerase FKBP14 isoform X2 n=1 Tax=Nannospalax galili TaxID=1026970 RepID=UPI00111C8C6D|nr:peptidyl-prolyl cis-trans isomerase FKBP14 isoform X2 [Nannospalax galili]